MGLSGSGYDVPDIAPTAKPELVQPFIMNQEGTARLWVRGLMKDGPFPTHYEPFESPVVNVVAPAIRGNPAARVFKDDLGSLCRCRGIPLCGNKLPAHGTLPLLDEARAD